MAGFIKAYCKHTKQYFGMMVENGRVVDFYDMTAEEGQKVASTVDIENLQTAENLRSCFVCGKRNVGKCDCAKRKFACSTEQRYRYQCIYCNQLHICTVSEGSELSDSSKIGEKVVLAQGQEVEITAMGGGVLEEILIGVGWSIAAKWKATMDLDASVFVQSRYSTDYEVIYYGNKVHPSGCVVHDGDNLVGGLETQYGDSENIHIYLKNVPENRDELYFVLNIYDAYKKEQTFRDVRNMYIRLKNAKTNEVLVEYLPTQAMNDMNGIVIARAYRNGRKWNFKAIGKPILVKGISEIHSYCREQ